MTVGPARIRSRLVIHDAFVSDLGCSRSCGGGRCAVLNVSMDELNASIHQWVSQFGWTSEAIVKLLLAGLFGGLVGLEREVRGREAGFRTNILVCVGSALVMLVSIRFAYEPWPQHGS